MRDNELIFDCEKIDTAEEREKTTYIGVFTCKGGVGKTTISAHLAGAFALNGYDVGLIDLDHQQNFEKSWVKAFICPQHAAISVR